MLIFYIIKQVDSLVKDSLSKNELSWDRLIGYFNLLHFLKVHKLVIKSDVGNFYYSFISDFIKQNIFDHIL